MCTTKSILSAAVASLLAKAAMGTTYYVGTGPAAQDSNPGTSGAQPFATPQHAADLVQPGDTVLLMTGTYTNPDPNGAVMDIGRSGRADGWITFKAAPGQHPVLRSSGWGHVLIHKGARYVRIEGLDIYGHADDITLEEARKHGSDPGYAYTNTNGIIVDGRQDGDNKPCHIEIVGNTVRKCPGGGVAICFADYCAITDNVVFDNSWWSLYDTSGISIWQAWNSDRTTGYHNFVLRNQCFGNRNYIPDFSSKTITDGNGIILDSCKNTQIGSAQIPFIGRTLIANNLCYENGGSGIHCFMSEHADVVNNTCIDNNRAPEVHDGQCFPNSCDDMVFSNNILVGRPDKPLNSDWNNGPLTWDHNLLWGSKAVIVGPHDLMADPQFTVARVGDRLTFSESPHSPAIGAGILFGAVRDDLQKRPRPRGGHYDIGCLQSKG